MSRSEEFEKWHKTYVNVNKLLDVILKHIEKEDCQHCRGLSKGGNGKS
jgi:hypothetical protein